jgi:hypothetical protein
MTDKPDAGQEGEIVDVLALDVVSISVVPDGREVSAILLKLDSDEQLRVVMPPETLAKLEALLAQASLEQAKRQPRQ